MPKPVEPGPYGEDIARQKEREKQNIALYGEAMPQGKDFTKPVMAGVLNVAGALAEFPRLYSQFAESDYASWEKKLNDLDKQAKTEQEKRLIAGERARMQSNKEVFEKAKTKSAPIIKPAMEAVSKKLWDAAK